ncbi:hypothetical protein SDC9_196395 [bioreactor metagenome]|uniref:Uncharacterized protein n=1 Tax=bioreactor metagenome TaxID=1076179 RepID=A0A645INH1_9ZZZZ
MRAVLQQLFTGLVAIQRILIRLLFFRSQAAGGLVLLKQFQQRLQAGHFCLPLRDLLHQLLLAAHHLGVGANFKVSANPRGGANVTGNNILARNAATPHNFGDRPAHMQAFGTFDGAVHHII